MADRAMLLYVSSSCDLPLIDGKRIRLSEETWIDHISKHPETRGREHDVEYALRNPQYVANSLSGPGGKNNGALCFVRTDATPQNRSGKVTNRTSFLHVLVKADEKGPFVATALFADKHHGEVCWTPKDDDTEIGNDPKQLQADYDRISDVLYISLGDPVDAYSESGQDGLILRYSTTDERPCGVTVMSFSDWDNYHEHLDKHVAAFLHVPPHTTLELLQRV